MVLFRSFRVSLKNRSYCSEGLSMTDDLVSVVPRPIWDGYGLIALVALAPPVEVGLRHDFGVDRNSLPIFYDNLPVGTKIDYPRGPQASAVVRAASASHLPAGSSRPFNMRRN